ncbi:MAG: hypothetical protein ACYDDS_00530 [Candidatus Sulfotelmatobacter sp.]
MPTFNNKIEFERLIPELKDWNSGKGIDIDGWISCEGDHKHLIGYARILWPDFTEHDGCIFLGDRVEEENYQAFLAQTKGDKTRVEAVMNHQHIVDLFSRSHPERPTREVVIYLGRLMKDILESKLSRDFPGRKITVSFPEGDLEELLEYQITFFQER